MIENMSDRIVLLIPELVLFTGAVATAMVGLSRSRTVRSSVPGVAIAFLAAAIAAVMAFHTPERAARVGLLMPMLGWYVKIVLYAIGITLTMLSAGLIDRQIEQALAAGRAPFDALRVNRGEYHAFLLLSLTGASLVCNANDLIWLFLALELTSLPTYIMVAVSRQSRLAQESAVKYFFLGAMAAAIFLYGFALLYGATGTIVLADMQQELLQQASGGGLSTLALLGIILSLIGIGFKIVAVPMHFYAADVYEGAAAPVTAFLSFVPKAAGMVSIILVLSILGWTGHTIASTDAFGLPANVPVDGLPAPVLTFLWMVAVLTMTLGNVGALLQKSIKRLFAYSSIAHSGYMLIGVIAGPHHQGINAVLIYLLTYGVMNTAVFAVLAGLERRGEEIETLEDLAGLRHRHPWMTLVLAIAAGSLIGLPPLLGFWGKLYLFAAGIEAHQIQLVVIAGINSAISAWYYLRLVALPLLASPSATGDSISKTPSSWPRIAGIACAILIVAGPLALEHAFEAAEIATSPSVQSQTSIKPVTPPVDAKALSLADELNSH